MDFALKGVTWTDALGWLELRHAFSLAIDMFFSGMVKKELGTKRVNRWPNPKNNSASPYKWYGEIGFNVTLFIEVGTHF